MSAERTGPSQSLERASSPERDFHPTPGIYVVSDIDYLAGHQHGSWIAAAQPATEIEDKIRQLLAASPTARRESRPATEWSITNRHGFGCLQPSSEDSAEAIAEAAYGTVTYGEAFELFVVELDGGIAEGMLQRFEDCYVAYFPDMEACLDEFIEGMGWKGALQDLMTEQGIEPEFLSFDLEAITRQYREAWGVVEGRGGTVYIFNK